MANSILELLNKLHEQGIEIGAYAGYKNMLEVTARRSKKRPAFVKMAISDDDAEKMLNSPDGKILLTPCLILLPADKVYEIINEAKERPDREEVTS